MATIFSKKFARSTLELTIRTFAQALAGLLVAAGTGLIETSWPGVLSAAGMSAFIAFLMNVGGRTATGEIGGP